MCDARHEAEPARVFSENKQRGNCRLCRLSRKGRRFTDREDHGDFAPDKIARQLWQSLILVLGPPVNDCDVFALDVAPPSSLGEMRPDGSPRPGVEKSNHGHCWLRQRRGRPCCGAADERNKLAPSHSITSSAVASNDDGMVRPSALAALRLITSSNLTGPWTGNSLGFSPFRMRSA